jgi:hypothetical protein
LIDDVDYIPEVKTATDGFAADGNLPLIHIPSLRGIVLIEKPLPVPAE